MCDVSARLGTVCHEFVIFYFLVFSWAENECGRCQKTHSRGGKVKNDKSDKGGNIFRRVGIVFSITSSHWDFRTYRLVFFQKSRTTHYPCDEVIEKTIPTRRIIWFFDANLVTFVIFHFTATGMRFPASPWSIFGYKKNSKIKNWKFLTNGASTCRDIDCRLLDLKSMQNPLYSVE